MLNPVPFAQTDWNGRNRPVRIGNPLGLCLGPPHPGRIALRLEPLLARPKGFSPLYLLLHKRSALKAAPVRFTASLRRYLHACLLASRYSISAGVDV